MTRAASVQEHVVPCATIVVALLMLSAFVFIPSARASGSIVLSAWGGNGGVTSPIRATLSSPATAGMLLVVYVWASWADASWPFEITPDGPTGAFSAAYTLQYHETTDYRGSYYANVAVEYARVNGTVGNVSLSWGGGTTPYASWIWAAAFTNAGGVGNVNASRNAGGNTITESLLLSGSKSVVMSFGNELISDLSDECGVNGVDMNGAAKNWTHGPTGYQEYSYILGNVSGSDPIPHYYFDYCLGNELGAQGQVSPTNPNGAGHSVTETMYPMRGFNGNHFFSMAEIRFSEPPPPPPALGFLADDFFFAIVIVLFIMVVAGAFKLRAWMDRRDGT